MSVFNEANQAHTDCDLPPGIGIVGLVEDAHDVESPIAEHVKTPLHDIQTAPIDTYHPSSTFPHDYEFTHDCFGNTFSPYQFYDLDYMPSKFPETYHTSDSLYDSAAFSAEQCATTINLPAQNSFEQQSPTGPFSHETGMHSTSPIPGPSSYIRTPLSSTTTSTTPQPVSSPGTTRAVTYSCTWPTYKRICSSRTEYTKHIQNHSRPFQCPSCPERRATKRHLDRHINDRHAQTERYYCIIDSCKKSLLGGGNGFPREDNCMRHMKTQHQMNGDEGRNCLMDEETKKIRRARKVGKRRGSETAME